MVIQVKKFGTVLTSRPSGREVLLTFRPTLNEIKKGEEVTIDFDGVDVLAPSWADEFLTPLKKEFGELITLQNIDNASVQATLSTLYSS